MDDPARELAKIVIENHVKGFDGPMYHSPGEKMTATREDIDLSWVTFSDETGGAKCNFRLCNRQATHMGIFTVVVGSCSHTEYPYCLTHRDVILARASDRNCRFEHPACPGSTLKLVRMEPIR